MACSMRFPNVGPHRADLLPVVDCGCRLRLYGTLLDHVFKGFDLLTQRIEGNLAMAWRDGQCWPPGASEQP